MTSSRVVLVSAKISLLVYSKAVSKLIWRRDDADGSREDLRIDINWSLFLNQVRVNGNRGAMLPFSMCFLLISA